MTMIDIVKRLQYCAAHGIEAATKAGFAVSYDEAAEAIENLEEELFKEKQYGEREHRGSRSYYQEVMAAGKLIAELREQNEKLRAENEKLLRRSKMWFKIAQDLGHQDTFLPDMGDSDD